MKKLIIVCEEKFRQYGDFLAQLISLEDDKNDQVVGVKDGNVAAQVWTEKEYGNNAIQLSSEQYILFVGNSKMIKDKRIHMQKMFSEYGMQYCWLGKQGVIFVDNIVSLNDYDNFFEYTRKIQPEVKKLIEKKSFLITSKKSKSVDKTYIVNGVEKLIRPIQGIPEAIVNLPILGMNTFAKVTNNKKIEEQEYSCLTLLFYLNGLSKFLGLIEE